MSVSTYTVKRFAFDGIDGNTPKSIERMIIMIVRVYDTDSSAQPLFMVVDVDSVTITKDGTWLATKTVSEPAGKQNLMYEASTHKIVIERSGSEE